MFVCPECTEEVVFYEIAVDKEAGKVRNSFPCPHCNAELTKQRMKRAWETGYDSAINETVRQAKQVPVLINYSLDGRKGRFEKTPDEQDFKLIRRINDSELPYWFPINRIIDGKEIGRLKLLEVKNIHQLLPKRGNWILSSFVNKCSRNPRLLFIVTSALLNLSWMYRWRANGKGGITSGTYYICATPQRKQSVESVKHKTKRH